MPAKKEDFNNGGSKIFTILFIIILVVAAYFAFNYWQAKKKIIQLTDPAVRQEMQKKEIDGLLEKIKRHMVLPTGEPKVATVKDVKKLAKEQAFFKDAQNGDKVLIFKDRAIIYRPETDLIINVGPVYQQPQQNNMPTQKKQSAPAEKKNTEEKKLVSLNIDIRNGSKVAGAASKLAKQLESNDNYQILNVTDAANKNYKENVLVNLTNKDVSALEKELGVKATKDLPKGEKASTADVLIILGAK